MNEKLNRGLGVLVAAVCIPVGLLMVRVVLQHPGPNQKKDLAGAGCVVVFGVMGLLVAFGARAGQGGSKTTCDSLDTPLLRWGDGTHFSLRQLCNGGCVIYGRTGAGKSSSSGYQLGKAIVKCKRRIGGCILGSKPEDPELWGRIFREAGRPKDLIIFDPTAGMEFNLLDYLFQSGADTREITDCILTISELLGRSQSQGGGSNERYWESLKRRTLHSAIEILRKALGRVTAPDIQEFILDAAQTPARFNDPEWMKGFHMTCLTKAHKAPKTEVEKRDHKTAKDMFMLEYPGLDPKVRSSSLADLLNTLSEFNSGMVYSLLSRGTNVSPTVMDEGKWVLVNTPIHTNGAGGLFVEGAWKFAVQKHILRRKAGPDTCPIILVSDEFQNTVNSFDSKFLPECRSHLGAMVVMTQGISSLFGEMDDVQGNHRAKTLMGNFATKIFHTLGSDEDASYATALVGKSLQSFFGGGMRRMPDSFTSMFGESMFSGNFSERFEQIIQNNSLFKLRTGGPENDYFADALVVLSGKAFASGENWAFVPFSQR